MAMAAWQRMGNFPLISRGTPRPAAAVTQGEDRSRHLQLLFWSKGDEDEEGPKKWDKKAAPCVAEILVRRRMACLSNINSNYRNSNYRIMLAGLVKVIFISLAILVPS